MIRTVAAFVVTSIAVLATCAASAQERPIQPSLSTSFRFTETSGEDLFASACQGCHMPDGRGAEGAGRYPALANNSNLAASGYPVYIVVRGQRAMPPIGALMNNDQVAAVVNYVRTHFGNHYDDAVNADDVKTVRP